MPIIPSVRRTSQRLIALALVFAAGLLLTGLPGHPSRAHADNVCTPDSSWGTVNSSYASQVLTLVNQHRAAIGVGQLSTDGALTASAVWKSMNMAGLNYFDHNDDPIGRTVAQRLAACGWPSNLGWGENIAYGYSTPADVMNGWLNSPGHKANIENPSYTSIGIGVAANSQGVYYWTQDFGQGSSGGSPPPTTTSAAAADDDDRTASADDNRFDDDHAPDDHGADDDASDDHRADDHASGDHHRDDHDQPGFDDRDRAPDAGPRRLSRAEGAQGEEGQEGAQDEEAQRDRDGRAARLPQRARAPAPVELPASSRMRAPATIRSRSDETR